MPPGSALFRSCHGPENPTASPPSRLAADPLAGLHPVYRERRRLAAGGRSLARSDSTSTSALLGRPARLQLLPRQPTGRPTLAARPGHPGVANPPPVGRVDRPSAEAGRLGP